MKLTKRKAFNFLRSYFDVLNKLQTDEDKLSFLMAVINKQFLNEDPESLQFPVDLAYDSQINAIDSSVKGWIRAAKTDLQGNSLDTPPTPPKGKTHSNPKEEEEEVQEEVQYVYKIENFLENWNQLRSHYLKTPSNLNKLYREESDSFNDLENDTTKEQYHKALHGLFKQQKVPADVMWFRPKHFLNNIDTYLDAELNKKYNLYV